MNNVSKKIYDLCCLLEDKKAEDITVCNTEKLPNAVNFYVLATATSCVHAKSILDYVEQQIQEKELFLYSLRDGFNTSNWLVLDVGEGFIHIFTKELRERYNIEKLVNEGNNVRSFEKLKRDFEKQVKLECKKTKTLATSKANNNDTEKVNNKKKK